jgi:hypothetical protein
MTEKKTSKFLQRFLLLQIRMILDPPGSGSGYVIICTGTQFTHPSFHQKAKKVRNL